MKIFLRIVIVSFVCQLGFSQEILVPFRDGQLWGLSNLKGELKLQPSFKRIIPDEQYPANYFVGVKNDEISLLYGTKEIISHSMYDKFRFNDNSLIVARQSKDYPERTSGLAPGASDNRKHSALFGLTGKDIYPQHFADLDHIDGIGYSAKVKGRKRLHLFACKGFDGRYSLFQYDADLEKITKWLLTDYFEIRQSKGRKLIAKKANKDSPPEEYYFAYYGKQIALSTYEVEDEKETNPFPEVGTYDPGEAISSVDIDINGPNAIEFVKDDGKVYRVETAAENIISKTLVDFNGNPEEVVLMKYSKRVDNYFFRNMGLKNEFKNYVRFKANGKYGLVCDVSVIAPEYDSIAQTEFNYPDNLIYFMATKKDASGKQKKGAISWNGENAIPFIYDEIVWYNKPRYDKSYIFPLEEWVVRIGDKYGMINFKNEVLVEPVYDEVSKSSERLSAIYILRQGEKYGAFIKTSNEKFVTVQPKFSRKPYEAYTNYQHDKNTTLIVFDNEGPMNDYANPDGTLYFKN